MKSKWLKVVEIIFLTCLILFVILNRVEIADFTRGIFYQPSADEAKIREKLNLTNKGLRVFNASYPSLNSKDEFNENCVSYDISVYVLGCYANKKIYVYDITDESLDGIRELTMAHELLHAIYERMSENTKNQIKPLLESVYQNNLDKLGAEIATYEDVERYDELYARIGTEIANLPHELEKHFSEIFQNQDLIVSYYEKYITPFQKLKAKIEELETILTNLEEEINAKTDEYTTWVESYNTSVTKFNSCADTAGCFKNNHEFQQKRAVLISEGIKVAALKTEINNLINNYNTKVEEYNQNVLKNQELQNLVNSNAVILDL